MAGMKASRWHLCAMFVTISGKRCDR
jgi:hypothetical protein